MKTRSAAQRQAGVVICIATLLASASCVEVPSVSAQEGVQVQGILFPAPMERKDSTERLTLLPTTRIVFGGSPDGQLRRVAAFLQEEIEAYCGLQLSVQEELPGASPTGCILVGLLPGSVPVEQRTRELQLKPVDKSDGYLLHIGKGGALIAGRDVSGAYYGALTLLQRLHQQRDEAYFAGLTVRDWPQFPFRGMRLMLPRGKPRPGEIDKAYFMHFLRAISFLKMNQAVIQGFPWGVPLQRRPGLAWGDVLTGEDIREINNCGTRHFLQMCPAIASAPAAWAVNHFPQLVEVRPGEDPGNLATWGYRKGKSANRQNLCPSNEETYKLLFDIYDEIIPMFSGGLFDVGVDEVHHEQAGGRWCACAQCRDKDPAVLFAEYVNRLCEHVIEKGRTPIVNSTMLIREHGGGYQNLFTAAKLIRKDVIIRNWSETHVRKQVPGFQASPYFNELGFARVIHMVSAGRAWQDRQELAEVRGKLDAFGVEVSHYAGMQFDVLEKNGTLRELVFTAENAWSPDLPTMQSREESRQLAYAFALLCEVVLHGKRFTEAIEAARSSPRLPGGEGTTGAFQ